MEFTTNVTDIQVTSASSKTAEVQFTVQLSFYNAANAATIPALQITQSPSTTAPSAIAEDKPASSRLVIEQEAMRVTREK